MPLQVFEGVCTTYMQQLTIGSSIDVLVRVSKFKLPKQLNCPVIMIGQHHCRPHIARYSCVVVFHWNKFMLCCD